MTLNSSTQEVLPKQASPVKKRVLIKKLKRRLLKHVWLVRAALIAAFAGILVLLFILVNFIFGKTAFGSYVSYAFDFIFTPQEKVQNHNGSTNILVLGKGGQGHDAPDLTDTIIFLSVSHRPASLRLISLPRDIWIPEIRAKVNSAYYWGNQRQPGGGMLLAKSTVEEIVGRPIHYAAVVDFAAFKSVVDVLGGVEVEVERGFTDERFPIPGKENDECEGDPEFKCRYETVRFEKGLQRMDGDTALKFVRSRNAEGDEGTDIAREARQQKVITAIKKKILGKDVLFSPKTLLALLDVAKKHVETDLAGEALAIIARRTLQAKDEAASFVLPDRFLLNPPKDQRFDNLYVFVPRAGDWGEVHDWVGCVLGGGACD
jgi:LCP family protein required for cell wall assembly